MILTPEQIAAITDKVNGMDLSQGLGDKISMCSIGAINWALTGELTDKTPECMSPVICTWIIAIQDRMPYYIRNSNEWKSLLPLAADTGKEFETKRLGLILEWMWEILASLQPIADKHNFGEVWQDMIQNKTADAASASRAAACADYIYWAANAAYWAANAANAANALATNAANYNWAVRYAVYSVYSVAAAADSDFWQKFNPCNLLEKLIEIS